MAKYGVHICSFHDASGEARVGNRTWRWDFSERFGPLLVDKQGTPLRLQPVDEKHPFWPAFEAWLAKRRASRDDEQRP